ncbi:diacylglycerol/lipid kinase family protein [Cellulomonas carbonis]|uniref:Diacylglycerol kinase n=1 Tax=Cellulomonas carbonis T26 TaxID=947969 RepID=A0A0A0BS17_9CELL|nr:diacylglycerol kinase family protein [Cellulomonas carbonis]KGM10715.1 diacylglycerol kinase [Cellulomonas carbonis T26]GGC02800.1 sphingosine kinase [Cellulomonas carbonis]
MTWVGWLAVAATVIALVALVLVLRTRQAMRGHGLSPSPRAAEAGAEGTASTDETPAAHTLVAFVANPTKPGVPELRDAAVQACAARYLPEPMWFDTTAEDPGIGQAREAIEKGAQLVVAVGGDGTVRAVAEGLSGTGVAMGLLPQGTGNLLARNLDIPLTDVEEMLRIALTGDDLAIDVGWLTVVRDESDVRDDIAEADPEAVAPEETPADTAEPARDHIFLVMAGLGFDAAVMGDTDEDLKAKVGWFAYFLAGAKHLRGRRMRVAMSVDGEPWRAARLRSIVFGNVGRLPGGITLIPGAEANDGVLHVGALDARGGILGWLQLFSEVSMQRFGFRTELPNRIGRIDHVNAREVRVRSRDPQPVQVDGDTIGEALEVAAKIQERALVVRVPVGDDD